MEKQGRCYEIKFATYFEKNAFGLSQSITIGFKIVIAFFACINVVSLMEKFLDIRKLIENKNKKLLRWMPQFMIQWFEKIIRQDDVNAFMNKYRTDDEYVFCRGVVDQFNLNLNLRGEEYIPSIQESCIFVGNHPLGGMDAIAVIHLFKDFRPDIHFIVNDILLNIKQLKGKFIGVNKIGKSASTSLQMVEKQFASDAATFIFPAGLVSRMVKGKIQDLTWKKTFITKAKMYQKPVVPVRISGRLTDRFYRLANVRNFLGIKWNIEMFFLVDELFRQSNARIDVAVGRPIAPETFTKERSDVAWAQWVKEKVYQL